MLVNDAELAERAAQEQERAARRQERAEQLQERAARQQERAAQREAESRRYDDYRLLGGWRGRQSVKLTREGMTHIWLLGVKRRQHRKKLVGESTKH